MRKILDQITETFEKVQLNIFKPNISLKNYLKKEKKGGGGLSYMLLKTKTGLRILLILSIKMTRKNVYKTEILT